MVLPSLLAFPLLEGHACWSTCGRRTRPCYFPKPLLKGVAKAALYCAHRTSDFPALYPYPARRLVWSPLRASSDHRFIVGALRAQRPCQLSRTPLPSSPIFSPGGLVDPRMRASDEHSFIVRVLRARRMVWWLPIPPFELARVLTLKIVRHPIPETRLPSPVEGRLTEPLYRRSMLS
jgi:hypothetical protein